MRVLVTGGTGVLGSATVRELRARGATVRVLSRRPRPAQEDGQVEWAQGDLLARAGLPEALAGVNVVVHSATTLNAGKDVQGTRNLLAEARQAGVQHLVYPSIVGIDALGFYDYYAGKLACEAVIRAGGVPHSIQRATQFHDLVHTLLGRLSLGPVLLLPRGVTLQPMDAQAVAVRMAEAALAPAAGRLSDLAGPEIKPLPDLAREWLRARGERKRVQAVPLPLPLFRAMASGNLVSVTAERVGPGWQEWLQTHANEANRYRNKF